MPIDLEAASKQIIAKLNNDILMKKNESLDILFCELQLTSFEVKILQLIRLLKIFHNKKMDPITCHEKTSSLLSLITQARIYSYVQNQSLQHRSYNPREISELIEGVKNGSEEKVLKDLRFYIEYLLKNNKHQFTVESEKTFLHHFEIDFLSLIRHLRVSSDEDFQKRFLEYIGEPQPKPKSVQEQKPIPKEKSFPTFFDELPEIEPLEFLEHWDKCYLNRTIVYNYECSTREPKIGGVVSSSFKLRF